MSAALSCAPHRRSGDAGTVPYADTDIAQTTRELRAMWRGGHTRRPALTPASRYLRHATVWGQCAAEVLDVPLPVLRRWAATTPHRLPRHRLIGGHPYFQPDDLAEFDK